MVTADIAENDLIKMLERFDIFERNKISLKTKLTAIAMYLVSSSFRKIALLLNVGKSTVHYWIDKFKDVLESNGKEKVKKLVITRITVDETILKYNGKKCYLFAALDDGEKQNHPSEGLSCKECFDCLLIPQGSAWNVRGWRADFRQRTMV